MDSRLGDRLADLGSSKTEKLKGGTAMLLCIVCGKVIANVDPYKVRYGGCSECDLDEVVKRMEEMYPELKVKKVVITEDTGPR